MLTPRRWWQQWRLALAIAYPGELLRLARTVLLVRALALVVLLGVLAIASLLQPAQAQPAEAARHAGTLKREAQRVWGLGAPVATFAAQLHQESGWRANARSPVGALGLAQFMPGTAAWIGQVDAGLATAEPHNPTWALRALVVYDHWIWQRVRLAADGCQRMAYTLAAYNGGLGWVIKRQREATRLGKPDPGVCLGATCAINPGISLAAQRENEHYPRAVLAREALYLRWGAASCLP